MRFRFGIYFGIWILSFVIFTAGCASIEESAKGILGLSTRSLEEARRDAAKETFKCDYPTCHAKTLEILNQLGAYVYAQDKREKMLAIYVSWEDTTPVGIFFRKIDANNTEIEVSSLSTLAKEQIAAKLFSRLVMAVNSKDNP